MGRNIPGGNFLGENFPGRSLMGMNFPGENFPWGEFSLDPLTYLHKPRLVPLRIFSGFMCVSKFIIEYFLDLYS